MVLLATGMGWLLGSLVVVCLSSLRLGKPRLGAAGICIPCREKQEPVWRCANHIRKVGKSFLRTSTPFLAMYVCTIWPYLTRSLLISLGGAPVLWPCSGSGVSHVPSIPLHKSWGFKSKAKPNPTHQQVGSRILMFKGLAPKPSLQKAYRWGMCICGMQVGPQS